MGPLSTDNAWGAPGRLATAALCAGSLAITLVTSGAAAANEATRAPEIFSKRAWDDPPRDARPVARWWWPGGSVDRDAIDAQLEAIAAAGFGGVELQPLLLGIGEDDLAADPRLRSVGTPGYRALVAYAAQAAGQHGLAFDLTLGSGWPGGLPTARANAERQLLMTHVDVEGPDLVDVAVPAAPDQSYRRSVEWVLDVLGPMDEEAELVAVVAARVGPNREGVPTLSHARALEGAVANGRLRWTPPSGTWRVFIFFSNSTEHFVMGGAFPGAEADARVVDHLAARGADALLEGYADPLLAEVGARHVRDVFVDSFELMGELPFTAAFFDAFESRAGYDVTPDLPLLFRRGGESKYAEMMDLFGRLGGPVYVDADSGRAERVREDYERVRSGLFEEAFVARFAGWSHARGLGLRLQAHGGYGDILDTYALADVPESEGLFAGGAFDFLKLASSAAHVAGRRWASSESFITLRLFGRSIANEEMQLLAGRAFAAGINRIVYHGVAQPYVRADGARWFPFSGGFGRILAGPLPMSLDVDAARLAAIVPFNRALARSAVAMSSGDPASDVAWLHPDATYPDAASLQLGRIEAHAGESTPTAALRARGLTHDRVSRRMLTGAQPDGDGFRVGAMRYRALLVDPLDVAEPELVEAMARIAEHGVPVFTLGQLPARAPGLHDADGRDARVRSARKRLEAHAQRVAPEALEAALARRVRGDLVAPAGNEQLTVSLARRTHPHGDTLLVFNESWSPTSAQLRFVRSGHDLTRWNPETGAPTQLRARVESGDVVSVPLEPAAWTILTLGRTTNPAGRGRDDSP